MKKQLKKLENKNMQLTIELDKAEWEALVDESYNKNKGKYKVEGFRAGKAPRKMIEKMYGMEVFRGEIRAFIDKEYTIEQIENGIKLLFDIL